MRSSEDWPFLAPRNSRQEALSGTQYVAGAKPQLCVDVGRKHKPTRADEREDPAVGPVHTQPDLTNQSHVFVFRGDRIRLILVRGRTVG